MYLICDIDGTLVKFPQERRLAAFKQDWESFYTSDFAQDAPIQGVVSLLEAWLEGGGIAHVVTARLDRAMAATCQWLVEHLPAMNRENLHLRMRTENETEPEVDWKVKQIVDICPNPSAATVIEDNPETCYRLSKLGYTVLEVR